MSGAERRWQANALRARQRANAQPARHRLACVLVATSALAVPLGAVLADDGSATALPGPARPTAQATEQAATARLAPSAALDVSELPALPLAVSAPSAQATVVAAGGVEEDTVVGAAKREQSLGNVASAVTVISADRIRRFGYRTVAEAIAGAAGIYLSDDRMQQRVGVRGLQLLGDFNTRLLVLIDGTSVNEAWGSLSGVAWDVALSIDEIARIEVIRGPVSSVYGTNAFFGIINIVTRSSAETARAWGRTSVSAIGGGTFAAGVARGDVHRQLRLSVAGMRRVGESLAVDGIGSALNADGGYAVTAGVVGTYDGWFGQARVLRHQRQSPFAPYDSDPVRGYTSYNTQGLIDVGHTRALSKRWQLAGRGYSNLYRFNDEVPKLGRVDTFDTIGDAQSVGGELRTRYDAPTLAGLGRVGLTAGVEANYHRTRSRAQYRSAPTAIDIPVNFNVEAAYAEVDGAPTSWLAYAVGVRGDRHSLLENRLSPRLGVFASRGDHYGAKLLYAEGFRNPSMFEGFFDDGEDYRANPNIRAEVIRSAETVLWARPQPGLTTRVSLFHWRTSRIVEQRDVAAGVDQFQNVGEYTSTGLEVEGSWRTASGWFAYAGGMLARVRGAGDALVPNAPATIASAGISSAPLWRNRLQWSTEVQWLGARPTQVASTTAPGYLQWNAALVMPRWRGFDIAVVGRNLVGQRADLVAPQDYNRLVPAELTIATVPGEGRELMLRMGYQWR